MTRTISILHETTMSKTLGRRAVFLERDGVLNEPRPALGRPEQFQWRAGAIDALRTLDQAGWRLVIVTNQPDIARGLVGPAEYDNLTGWMQARLAAQGVLLDGIYHCPHLPDAPLAVWCRHCDCRKPAPGLLRRAARDLQLDLRACVMVGPQACDIAAGRAAGLGACVRIAERPDDTQGAPAADYTCPGLPEAADWLLSHERRRHA